MKRVKELYLYLDNTVVVDLCDNYISTLYAIQYNDTVRTTQTSFLSFKYAEKLFVIFDGITREIKLGKTVGCSKEIREVHNIEKMLLNGAFDWFNPDKFVL